MSTAHDLPLVGIAEALHIGVGEHRAVAPLDDRPPVDHHHSAASAANWLEVDAIADHLDLDFGVGAQLEAVADVLRNDHTTRSID
ncbi:MAG: hypothetical protein R2694_16050 [Ilumatobacteraceae bacterium]